MKGPIEPKPASSAIVRIGTSAWSRHWIETGFDAYEASIVNDKRTGAFSHGDSPTTADLCLVPQVFNAARFKVDMDRYPTIRRIHEACMKLSAFDHSPTRPEIFA